MDHLLNIKPFPSPPSYELKLKAQHQTSTKAVLRIKHLLHVFILKHAGRLAGALGGAKSVLLDLLNMKTGLITRHSIKLRKNIKRKGKKPCGGSGSSGGSSIAMHLNLLPAAMPSWESAVVEPFGAGLAYYDPSWNTVIPAEQLPPMSGYLEWPEEDQMEDDDEKQEEDGCNEIDRLAEKFIARCHERFMLEKQQSYRRFQEMLARSL